MLSNIAAKLIEANTFFWISIAIVVIGAVWFGFASCGGYAWHRTAFAALAIGISLIAILVPSTLLRMFARKFSFLFLLALAYFLIEAGVSPFYPSPPQSIGEYIQLFLHALEYGPCG